MFSFSTLDLAFMEAHAHAVIPELLLRGKWTPREKELLEQIFRKQKHAKKLPQCAENPQFYWPPTLNLEQCSSEKTARFKASLINGHRLIDLSAGLGIDSLYLSEHVETANLIEPDAELSAMSAYNLAAVMGKRNLIFHSGLNAESFLKAETGIADWIYVDPSRRNVQGQKVFKLADCEPNIIALASRMLAIAPRCLIKLSPMADVQQLRRELPGISRVYALHAEGECKELLLVLENKSTVFKKIAVDLDAESAVVLEEVEGQERPISYGLPQTFIYEPNAAIHKLGLYAALAREYQLVKLHPDSHLFTSGVLVPDFPGRVFTLNEVLSLDRKVLWHFIPERKANITVRNFPLSVAEIRAKTKLVDGGSVYLLATTLIDRRKVLLFCSKAN